jgi:hypothetical protein
MSGQRGPGGSVAGGPRRSWRPETRRAKFWARVNKTDACWLWTGAISTEGYGRITWDYRNTGAHRVSYQELVGPIPDGLMLDHLCRVRHCVNPAHLEPVTNAENTIRGIAARPPSEVCRNGHRRTPENTRRDRAGWLDCLDCRKTRRRRMRARKKAA